PQVEARPADENGERSPAGHVPEGGAGVSGEVGEAERLIRLDEVQAVMRDPAAFVEGRLRGADVEAAVDLAGVGGDDLGGDPLPRQALRDVDREPGLAGGGRAGDDEEGRGSRGPRLWRSAQPLWLAGGHLAARANSRIKRISNHSAIRTGRAGPVGRARPLGRAGP